MNLFEMKQNHAAAMAKADSIVAAAEKAGRMLTATESTDVAAALNEVTALNPQIAQREKYNTMSSFFQDGRLLIPSASASPVGTSPNTKALGSDYLNGFRDWVLTGGEKVSASLYEGAGPNGGFAVPVIVANQVVPLAPPETGVRSIATVLTTTSDIKVPRQTAFSVAAAKPESGATPYTFNATGPTLDQFTLSAFTAGATVTASWELLQDVPAMNAFITADLLNAQTQLEEGWYISGTGVGQAQGLIGNVGPGITGATPDANGNLVSISSTFDLVSTLNAEYQENATFLMSRATALSIRKAQMQANLFAPVFTSSNGRDYLHGRPVTYSAAMPTAVAGSTPILFGDFKAGYVLGERGGPGISTKILDQPLATSGQTILLVWRRVDGRVRRSEAIQGLTLHS